MENFEQFVERYARSSPKFPNRDALLKKNEPIAPDRDAPSWENQVKLDMDADDRAKMPPSPGSREDLARPFQKPEKHLKSQQAWSEFKPELRTDPTGDYETVYGVPGQQYQKADQMNKRFDSKGNELKGHFKQSVQEYVGKVIRNGQSKTVLLRFAKQGEESSNQINLLGVLSRSEVQNIHPAAAARPEAVNKGPVDNPRSRRNHYPVRSAKPWHRSKNRPPGPKEPERIEKLENWTPEGQITQAELRGAEEWEREGGDREEQNPADEQHPITPHRDGEEDTPPGDSFEDYMMPSRRLTNTPDAEEEPDAEERLKRLTHTPDDEAEEEIPRLTHTPDDEEEEQSAIKVNLTGPDGRKHTMANLKFDGHMLRPVEDDEMDSIIDLTNAGIRLNTDRKLADAAKRVKHRHDQLGYDQLSDKEKEWLKQIGEIGKPDKEGFWDSYDWANNHDDVQVMLEKFLSRG